MTEPAPYSSVDLSLIKQILPHRYPFLMIDKVRDIVPFEGGVGIKMVTSNEPHFQGHFPEEPVMPGVLIVEAMAQTAAIVVGVSTNIIGGDMLTYFMGIDSCKFRRKVVPGDILELNVKCLRPGGKVWKFRGEATVDGELAAEAEFMAMMAPKPKA
ncbi:3-hydroxyacyl-ACP dehydratase FabZ [Paenirhodobacter enshiensis]|uniref:3-hydroxyacyl-[acyl-carrier-protein] dehydratase FabZ n=1 Tax=Paenirhodobacter enshiensis TaxID=1105367 RepID=A0A086XWN7_9RHOB|nr:3-hydroxyacyl-ACP dehydratase FabZ [Paenirhodobacter enshiensis]KFI26437.1 3-hydroxyacyl-ACP dehydratase [Paenirhodobacter enshiensis]